MSVDFSPLAGDSDHRVSGSRSGCKLNDSDGIKNKLRFTELQLKETKAQYGSINDHVLLYSDWSPSPSKFSQ